MILSPKAGSSINLGASLPVTSFPITLSAEIFENGIKIAGSVEWNLVLSWEGTYKTYRSVVALSGNPVAKSFSSGGVLRIRMSASTQGRAYSTLIKVVVLGQNPTKEQIKQALPDNDVLRAIAWQESNWRQFDAKGQPLKNPSSSMVGIMQISERWWGTDKAPIHSNDFNRIAWDWNYNIQAAKEILEYYFKRVTSKYPSESENARWNRAIKAYHAGESTIKTKESADDFWYVQKIRKHIKDKPWGK